MNTNSSSGSASFQSPSAGGNEIQNMSKPLWRYVKQCGKAGNGGGGVTWECNFCHIKKTTTYTRVKSHLLREKNKGITPCEKVTPKDLADMLKLLELEKKKETAAAPKKVPLPPSAMFSCELYTAHDSKKRKESGGSSSSLKKAFNLQGRNQLHALIARLFYASGLPFHLARSPYFVSSYSFAANNNLAGYVPPGYNLLRTSLLQQEKANVERLLHPIKTTWREKGVSIVSDGWSDSQRRPLINFMAVTESGPIFLKAVDCSGEVKDKSFIFDLMKEVIEEVGPHNVVQVITDNAKNCAGAGLLIEGKYPNIVWTPCVVHTLNLALQNICAAKNIENNQVTSDECSWISIIASDANMIKNFIMNHGMRYYSIQWLSEDSSRVAPHRDNEVARERIKCLKKYCTDAEDRKIVTLEFANFSSMSGDFSVNTVMAWIQRVGGLHMEQVHLCFKV